MPSITRDGGSCSQLRNSADTEAARSACRGNDCKLLGGRYVASRALPDTRKGAALDPLKGARAAPLRTPGTRAARSDRTGDGRCAPCTGFAQGSAHGALPRRDEPRQGPWSWTAGGDWQGQGRRHRSSNAEHPKRAQRAVNGRKPPALARVRLDAAGRDVGYRPSAGGCATSLGGDGPRRAPRRLQGVFLQTRAKSVELSNCCRDVIATVKCLISNCHSRLSKCRIHFHPPRADASRARMRA